MADAPHSKCGGAIRAGSSPATGTRIFSPELTEFRAFLLPDSLYSGVLRVKCENRICRRNLAAIIKVGVNIRCRSDVAMSQPLLDVPQTDTVGVKKAGTAMAEIVETDFFQSVVFQYNLEINTCVLLPFFQLRVTLFRMVSVIPDNAMFAGSKSTPSSWCKTP